MLDDGASDDDSEDNGGVYLAEKFPDPKIPYWRIRKVNEMIVQTTNPTNILDWRVVEEGKAENAMIARAKIGYVERSEREEVREG